MPNGVYDWKHGWVPITPRAALQKAHGSQKGAAKLLHANGPHKPAESNAKAAAEKIYRARGYDAFGKPYGKPAAPSGIRIEHTGDGTLVHGTSKGGPETSALKANGFKYSSNLGAWYLPRTWGANTREQRVHQLETALKAKGIDHHVARSQGRQTTAAERAAEQQARSGARAERLDSRAAKLRAESDSRLNKADALRDVIPFGQPILVGHHSEKRHRRDLERINSNMDKGIAAHREAESATQRAEAARRAAAGREDPGKIQRRIAKNEADLRSVQRTELLAGKLNRPELSPERKAQLAQARAELQDTISFDKSRLAEAQKNGAKVFSKADVSPGDAVKVNGSWYRVKRANAKSVTIPSIVGGSWTDTAPYSSITDVRRGASLSAAHVHQIDLAGVCTGPGPCDVKTLDRSPKANWVEKAGGLPLYIRAIANALKRQGKPDSQAIQIAVGTVQRWARGEGDVSAATRARAAAALAEWEAKRAKAHSLSASGEGVDLAARWKHGWIPLNAEAVEKAKEWKRTGKGPATFHEKHGGGSSTHVDSRYVTGDFNGKARRDRSGRSLNAEHDRTPASTRSAPDRRPAPVEPNRAPEPHGQAREINGQSRGQRESAKRLGVTPKGYKWEHGENGPQLARKNAPPSAEHHVQANTINRQTLGQRESAKRLGVTPKGFKWTTGPQGPYLTAKTRRPVNAAALGVPMDLAPGSPANETAKSRDKRIQKAGGYDQNQGLKAQGAAGGGGDFNSKHPRAGAGAGSATGGQFITAGSGGAKASPDEQAQVKAVQAEIGVNPTGEFTAGDSAALAKWQKKQGLRADGVAGAQTVSRMSDGPDKGPGALGSADRSWLRQRSNRGKGEVPNQTKTRRQSASLAALSGSVDLAATMRQAGALYRRLPDGPQRQKLAAALVKVSR